MIQQSCDPFFTANVFTDCSLAKIVIFAAQNLSFVVDFKSGARESTVESKIKMCHGEKVY